MGKISFETGPIRPPSEASSILLRLTRNCPWNRCTFCPVYKGTKYSRRTVEEIKSDIDAIRHISGLLIEEQDRYQGNEIFGSLSEKYGINEQLIVQCAFWLSRGMRSIFLQDADVLSMKTAELTEVLDYARRAFPSVSRITAYSRSHSISRKTSGELEQIREAGLDRLHTGMESGSNEVLSLLKKGTTQEELIDAGTRAMAAGFEYSMYFMPGAGGRGLSCENSSASAHVVNMVKPHFLRIRSTIPVPGTPLFNMMRDGDWEPVSEEGKVEEIRGFVEALENISTKIRSDHIMNLLEDIDGDMPADREKMLSVIESFFGMPLYERESFIIARRLGKTRFLSDFRNTPEIERIRTALLGRYQSVDDAVIDILKNYI